MAYNPYNMKVLSFNSGFTLYHYDTEDTMNEVKSLGYFNNDCYLLREGDCIIVVQKANNKAVSCMYCVVADTDETIRTLVPEYPCYG